jgi:hypothetical protein
VADPPNAVSGKRLIARQERTSIVFRALVTIFISSATFLGTRLAGQSMESTVLLSVFVGGVALVVQYLGEFQRQLQEGLATLNEATRLYQALRDSPVAPPVIEQLVTNLTAIRNTGIDMLTRLALADLQRSMSTIQQLSGSEASYDGEEREWLLTLTREAKEEIAATSSNLVDEWFWDTQAGDQYLREQADACARGVLVRRIFLVESAPSQGLTPRGGGRKAQGKRQQAALKNLRKRGKRQQAALKELRERQEAAGIKVRTLDVSHLTPAQRKAYRDLVLFDNRISYRVRPPARFGQSSDPADVAETQLSARREVVELGRVRFEELWALAGASDVRSQDADRLGDAGT